jgi:hypothetical protein
VLKGLTVGAVDQSKHFGNGIDDEAAYPAVINVLADNNTVSVPGIIALENCLGTRTERSWEMEESQTIEIDVVPCIPMLRRYALKLVRNGPDADDLVQDCLLRALSRRHQSPF